jgi:HSP20 family molecular chaperone IbpA
MAETHSLTPKDRTEASGPEQTRGGVFFTPRVDIFETENELTLFADVPGVRSDDVDLRYERGELVLHARVQPRHRNVSFDLQEYEQGDFFRAFTVHESIDAGQIQAACKNGILTVHLPKAEAVRPRQIKVQGQ